jgi:DNA primase small subunit
VPSKFYAMGQSHFFLFVLYTLRLNTQVNLGTDKNKDVHLPYPLHPMLQRAHAVLEPLFVQQILPAEGGHGLLASVDQWTALLESLPEPASKVRDTLLGLWAKAHSSPATKWEELKKHLSFFLGKAKGAKVPKQLSTKERETIEQWPVQTVFRHTYPRLDINVSKMRNHLLKSPFCVHPKTGRVCVPIQADAMDDFDPFIVPTLGQLMEELDAFDQEHGSDDKERSIPNWQKTSLKGYYEPFVKEFLEPLQKSIRRQEREAAEQKAAVEGDF